VTDNKAVELIFGNPNSTPKARIERWCLRLLPYKFVIKHQPGSTNIADWQSRNPLKVTDLHDQEDIAERNVNALTNRALPKALSRQELAESTKHDPKLQKAILSLQQNRHLGSMDHIKAELATSSDGILLKGDRIVMPDSLKHRIVSIAHQGHQGIVRTKQLLRQYVWFSGMEKAVEEAIRDCTACQINTKGHRPITLLSMSKNQNTTVNSKDHQERQWAPFNSAEFKAFAERLGFAHRRITPYWPRANGICERFMQNLGKLCKNVRANSVSF